eukprot:1310209-Pyramimonas_sp.AAC.1
MPFQPDLAAAPQAFRARSCAGAPARNAQRWVERTAEARLPIDPSTTCPDRRSRLFMRDS